MPSHLNVRMNHPRYSDRATFHVQPAHQSSKSSAQTLEAHVSEDGGCIGRRDNVGPESKTMTTVIIRNLPMIFSRYKVTEMLDSMDLFGFYNFVYLPLEFKSGISFGFAFVNFIDNETATWIMEHINDFDFKARWPHMTSVLVVEWSRNAQGFEKCVDRCRNSPVMHKQVPDIFKPMVFSDGVRVPFPFSTMSIPRPCRRRRHHHKSAMTVAEESTIKCGEPDEGRLFVTRLFVTKKERGAASRDGLPTGGLAHSDADIVFSASAEGSMIHQSRESGQVCDRLGNLEAISNPSILGSMFRPIEESAQVCHAGALEAHIQFCLQPHQHLEQYEVRGGCFSF